MARAMDTPNGIGGANISGKTVRNNGGVVGRDKVTKHFSSAPTRQNRDSQNQRNKPIQILFLPATPQDPVGLRLDEEIRGIEQALFQAELHDKLDIEHESVVPVTLLQTFLLLHHPSMDFQSITV